MLEAKGSYTNRFETRVRQRCFQLAAVRGYLIPQRVVQGKAAREEEMGTTLIEAISKIQGFPSFISDTHPKQRHYQRLESNVCVSLNTLTITQRPSIPGVIFTFGLE